jgi:hypothetical protein
MTQSPLSDEDMIDQVLTVMCEWVRLGIDERRMLRVFDEIIRRAKIVLGELEHIPPS